MNKETDIYNGNGLRAEDVRQYVIFKFQQIIRFGGLVRNVEGKEIVCDPQEILSKSEQITLNVVFGIIRKGKPPRLEKSMSAISFRVIQRDNKTVRLSMWCLDDMHVQNFFTVNRLWNSIVENFQGLALKKVSAGTKYRDVSLPKKTADARRWVIAYESVKERIGEDERIKKDIQELNEEYEDFSRKIGYLCKRMERNTWEKIIEWGDRKGSDFYTIKEFEQKYGI